MKKLIILLIILTYLTYATGADCPASAGKAHDSSLRPVATAIADKAEAKSGGSEGMETEYELNRRDLFKISAITAAVTAIIGFFLAPIIGSFLLSSAERKKKQDFKVDVIKELRRMKTERQADIPLGFFDMGSKALPERFRKAAEKVYKTTARILVYKRTETIDQIEAVGSGVVVSPDGHIMIAYHSIKRFLSDGNHYIAVEIPTVDNSVRTFKRYSNARVVKDMVDEELDIGVIKIDTDIPLDFVRPEPTDPKVGDDIIVFGHPRGTQRCYVSAGEVIESTQDDKAFQFRHNADARGGNSGSGVFLIDEKGDVPFIGICTKSGGIGRVLEEIFDPIEVLGKTMDMESKVPDEIFEKYSLADVSELAFHDVMDNSSPNFGIPTSFGITTRLSSYLSKNRPSKLVSYPYDPSKLTAFEGPTFALSRSRLMTDEKDEEAERIIESIVTEGPRLTPPLASKMAGFGISHIRISNHSKVSEGTLYLSYDTENPIGTIENLLAVEMFMSIVSEYSQKYGFIIDIDKDNARNEMLKDAIVQLAQNAGAIGAALKETEIKKIQISDLFGIISSKMMVHWNEPDIVKSIMEGIELEKLRIRTNKNLARYGFDIKNIFGCYDIEKVKDLIGRIEQDAKAVSELLKEKKRKHIFISFYNAVYEGNKLKDLEDSVLIDFETEDPLDSIRDAYERKPRDSSELKRLDKDLKKKWAERIKKKKADNKLYDAGASKVPESAGQRNVDFAIMAAA